MGAAVIEASIIRAWWPEDGEPRLAFDNRQSNNRDYIAPLLLVYGQQPPRAGTTGASTGLVIGGWWGLTGWTTPTPEQLAAWLQRIDTAPLQDRETQIRAALIDLWTPPWTGPQSAPHGPIPAQGQQPPRIAEQLAAMQAIVAQWPPLWTPAQSPAPTAGWNVPPPIVSAFIPPARTPWQVWQQWEPPWVGPPPLVDVTPLSFTYGQQPPRFARAALSALYMAWDPNAGQPSGPGRIAPLIPVPVVQLVPFSELPWAILGSWQTQDLQPPRPVAIAPVAGSFIPSGELPASVLQAWQPEPGPPSRGARIAALARAQGQPPPIAGVRREVLRAILDAYLPPPNDGGGFHQSAAILFRGGNPPPVLGWRREMQRLLAELWLPPWQSPQVLVLLPQANTTPIIPDGLPISGVPITCHFTTTAGPVPQVALITGAGSTDHTEVVCVCASFEDTDVIESAVLTVKLNGVVTLTKTITKAGPTVLGRIDPIGDQLAARALIFGLTSADNAALVVPQTYTIQVTVTRDGVVWPKVVQRGTVQSIPAALFRTGLVALLATQGGSYIGSQSGQELGA